MPADDLPRNAPTTSTSDATDVPASPGLRRRRLPEGGWGTLAPLLLGLLLAGSLGLLAYGIYLAVEEVTWILLAAGALATLVSLATTAICLVITRASGVGQGVRELATLVSGVQRDLDSALASLRRIDEHTLISERAKRVAYRDRDRDAVRQAIHEDLLAGDFASARLLVDEFEEAFGYKQEAERFREEIRRHADETRGHEMEDATSRIDQLCNEERWAEAHAEADRLISKFGGEIKVRLLRTRVEERRQQRKVQLVQEFHAARTKGDADAASDLLKRLDTYLTPDEGQQLQNDAREVLRRRLLSLKDRFTESMHNRDFTEALRIGAIIRQDYPNSQMAKEVAQHEPRLREAAGIAPEDENVSLG